MGFDGDFAVRAGLVLYVCGVCVMSDIQSKKARLKEIHAQREALKEEANTLSNQIALAEAKYKVGERLKLKKRRYDLKEEKAVEYAEVFEIVRINAGFYGDPNYFAAKIKKDGTPAIHERRLFDWDLKDAELVA